MGINFNVKQDYSFLFSSLSSSKNSNNLFNSINLSDYNSIKSGTYGKLLKEYYRKTDTDSTKETSKKSTVEKNESVSVKELKQIQTDANALRDSASKLMQRGSSSVLGSGDMEKAYAAVKEFADNYNTLMEEGTESDSKSIMRSSEGLVDLMKDYEDSLNEIGITIEKDNTLAVNKDTFLKSSMDKVQDLFRGNNSLSYLTSMRAVTISNTAYNESNKSNLYTGDGSYTSLSTGDIFNSII